MLQNSNGLGVLLRNTVCIAFLNNQRTQLLSILGLDTLFLRLLHTEISQPIHM